MSRWPWWGAALWFLRPVYVVIEVVVAASTTGGYSLVHDTVSRLGSVGCSTAFCSPGHSLMNATFIGVGLMLASGAFLLRASLGPAVTVLLVVSGLSSAATGLAPVDDDALLHTWAAAPLFVCQPLALLVLARRVRHPHGRLATGLLVTGMVTGGAAVGFFVVGDTTGGGLLERLALWPVLVALAAAAIVTTTPRAGVDACLTREAE